MLSKILVRNFTKIEGYKKLKPELVWASSGDSGTTRKEKG